MEEVIINAATIMGRKGGLARTEAKVVAAQGNGRFGGRPVTARLNDDGVSVAGCSYVYAPKGQALEYSALATNPYRGCGHKCAYCYVPNVLRITREEFDSRASLRPSYMHGLRKDLEKYTQLGITEQVMMSFTTDPYHPYDNTPTRDTILALQEAGLGVCTLTKGGSRALRDIKLFRPTRDAFASTLTSMDDAFSLKWERGAAPASDRVATLKKFHEAGIFTWVSLEPTLNCEASLEIVRQTHSFVDLYKVGRVNYLPMTKTEDWQDYTLRMIDLLNKLGARHYIKQDLQKFLPHDYANPLRIEQHN